MRAARCRPRSQSGGICSSMVLMRYRRSCRNSPAATISWISALVAHSKRTLIWMGVVPPKRVTCCFSMAVSSFICMAGDRLAISSKKSVPPDAISNLPLFSFLASVNAPFSYPKSSLSNSVSGMVPRSICTKRLIGPRGGAIQQVCDQIFSRAVLSQNQDIGIGIFQLVDGLKKGEHRSLSPMISGNDW
jgi:hypothetical protein